MPAQQQPAASSPKLTPAEMEEFLRTAKILERRTIPVGVTAPQRATLSDGSLTHDAQIQPVDIFMLEFQTSRGREMNFRDSWKFNIAAYRLDRILELNMIPMSVERRVDNKPAAVTWWLDDVLMTENDRVKKKVQPPDPAAWDKLVDIMRVFDELISNFDRNQGNIAITKDWKLWMIDHTRAFRGLKGLSNPQTLKRCERKLLAGMRALNEEVLTRELTPYLNRDQVRGLLGRRDRIVKLFDEQIATKGEAAVLYDRP